MFIFKVFKIRKQVRDVREGVRDPSGFLVKEAKAAVRGYMIFLVIVTILVLGLLFIFGYTNLIVEPSLFAQVLFWILLIPLLVFWGIAYFTWRAINRMVKRAQEEFRSGTIHVTAKVKNES